MSVEPELRVGCEGCADVRMCPACMRSWTQSKANDIRLGVVIQDFSVAMYRSYNGGDFSPHVLPDATDAHSPPLAI